MSVSLRQERETSISAGRGWMPLLPLPDGEIGVRDRAQLAGVYGQPLVVVPEFALTTRSMRESSVSVERSWMPILPYPDSMIKAQDRAQLAWGYRGKVVEANGVSIAPYEGMIVAIEDYEGLRLRIREYEGITVEVLES